MATSSDSELQRAYFVGFIAALLACLSPLKTLAYVVPTLVTVWLLLHAGRRTRNRAVLLAGGAVLVGVGYAIVAPEFLVQNYLLALVTYSTAAPLLLIESRELASRRLLERVIGVVFYAIAVEGALGILQAIYGAVQTGSFGGSNGDFVAGTIHPYPEAQLAFDNPAYAVNMIAMMLACLAFPRALTGRRRVCLAIGATAILLASVMHAVVFLIGALVIAFVWTWRRSARRTGRQGVAILVAIAVLGLVGVRRNVDTIGVYVEAAIDFEAVSVPRAILLGRVLFELPEDAPLQPVIGVGPGQFASRASLIASGMYLGGPDSPKAVPLIAPASTRLADDYCISLLVAYSAIDDGSIGSSQQPFFSVLSVYTETGLVGLGLVLWLVSRVAWRARARIRSRPELHSLGLVLVAGIAFFMLLGLQDNYWEVPQAVLVGALLFKLLYANLWSEDERASSTSAATSAAS